MCARLCLMLVPLFLLIACTSSLDETGVNSAKSSSDIQISSDKVYLSEINSQYQINATWVDAEGVAYLEQPEMRWSTSYSDVATVDAQGVITATGLGEAKISVSANGVSKSISVVVDSGVVTITGQVRYEDREYHSAGFSSKTDYFKTARFVKVDLVSQDNQTVQSTYTNDQGEFSFTGVINSQYKVTAYTVTDSSLGLNLHVKDRSDLLFAVTKSVVLDSENFMAIDIPLSTEASGAFNILDVLINAANFTISHTPLTQVSLAAFWEENNYDGTYYCNNYDSIYCLQGKGIYVYNAVGSDTDEYDDDVLYHEFGHYFLDTLSRDDSLGGCHLLSSRDLDLRIAWSEGFGDFFPAAIKHWLNADADRRSLLSSASSLQESAYIDTYRTSAQISIDLVNLDRERYSSAGNEMAIAKILYTLYLRFGMDALVAVLNDYLTDVATPVNLESFWDGWLHVHQPNENLLVTLQTIFNERKVYYQSDAFEGDDDIQSLSRNAIAYNSAETHYLYKPVNNGEDIDLIPFAVNAGNNYEVETLNLSGGSDTYVSILDSLGNPLIIDGVKIANDDHSENAYYGYDPSCGNSRVKNNATALASRVEFVSPISGTYHIEVRTTIDPEPYLSAGRYGNYDVLVREY